MLKTGPDGPMAQQRRKIGNKRGTYRPEISPSQKRTNRQKNLSKEQGTKSPPPVARDRQKQGCGPSTEERGLNESKEKSFFDHGLCEKREPVATPTFSKHGWGGGMERGGGVWGLPCWGAVLGC